MSDVLIRDLPSEDLDVIRAAAAERGQSLQSYLRGAVLAHAAHERRQQALRSIDHELAGLPAVAPDDRRAVLEAVEEALGQRADGLSRDPVEVEQG